MKTIVFIISIVALMACQKPEPILPEYNAEVLSFDSQKCYCKYGWMIKMGADTFLTVSPIMIESVGYYIDSPIKINIDVVVTDESCKYYYCDVISIKKNEFITY